MRAQIEAVLPAKDKKDLMWKLFFGTRTGPFTKDDVWAFHEWHCRNDIKVRLCMWREVNAQRWAWDLDYTNLRKGEGV